MGYLSAGGKQALSAAVDAIESASAAEIVVAFCPDSVPRFHTSALAAGVAGVLGLAFLLFSPWPFSNAAILLDTLVVGLLGAAVARRSSLVRRALTPRRLAQQQVDRAARAEFVERGVAETRDRSGILVFVSQTERCAAVVADRGVLGCVDGGAWSLAVTQIATTVRLCEDGVALAEAVRGLLPLLTAALPRRADDTDELANARWER
jgi:putative membrane protein